MGMDEYTETGGINWVGRIGPCRASYPFAKIYIRPEEIEVSVKCLFFSKGFLIPKSDIVSIRKERGLLSAGIAVNDSVEDLPLFTFWSLKFSALKDNLRILGYDVED